MRQKTDPKTGTPRAVLTQADMAAVYRTSDLVANVAMIERPNDFPALASDLREWAEARVVCDAKPTDAAWQTTMPLSE